MLHRPELLCPAGNMDRLTTALTYGADAVYLGGEKFNLRAKGANFSNKELEQAVSLVKKHKKKVYLCLNAYLYDHQISELKSYLDEIDHIPFDGVICADPGVIEILKKDYPSFPIHLSTQANTSNSYSVGFWKKFGIKRINIARETNLKDLKRIRYAHPDIELEVFIHGAMCMAISGRCHLSAYLNNRSANQGLCTHPCRFLYKIKGIAVEEKERPDRILWEYFEQDDFSAFFAAEDLCLVKYLKWFCINKIDAIKIEGRNKTSSYLGPVIDVYNSALQDLQLRRFRLDLYLKELKNSATRICNTGFFLPGMRKNIIEPAKNKNPVVFKVIEKISSDKYLISVRHKIDISKPLEIIIPGLIRPKIEPNTYAFEDDDGNLITEVNSGISCYFRYDNEYLKENFLVRGYL